MKVSSVVLGRQGLSCWGGKCCRAWEVSEFCRIREASAVVIGEESALVMGEESAVVLGRQGLLCWEDE